LLSLSRLLSPYLFITTKTAMELQNFASIFEILFAYNIGIGLSNKVRNLLGINESISKLIDQHQEFQTIHRIIERKKEYAVLFQGEFAKNIDKGFCYFKERTADFFNKHRLGKFLRPFYIYFGLLSLFYLFFAGSLDSHQDYLHLMLLNFVSSIIAFSCFVCSFLTDKIGMRWGNSRVFFASLTIIVIVLLIPKEQIGKHTFELDNVNFLNYIRINGHSNIQILSSVILVFTPVFVELLHVLICLFQLRNFKSKYQKFLFRAVPLLVNRIKIDTEIPEETIDGPHKV